MKVEAVLHYDPQRAAQHVYSEWGIQNFIAVSKTQTSGVFFLLQNETANSHYINLVVHCIYFNVDVIYQELFEKIYKTKHIQK